MLLMRHSQYFCEDAIPKHLTLKHSVLLGRDLRAQPATPSRSHYFCPGPFGLANFYFFRWQECCPHWYSNTENIHSQTFLPLYPWEQRPVMGKKIAHNMALFVSSQCIHSLGICCFVSSWMLTILYIIYLFIWILGTGFCCSFGCMSWN